MLRDDQTTSRLSSRLRKANYAPHVLGATPSIQCTENIEMYTEVYVTLNNERHNSGYPSSIFLKQILRHRYISQLALDHRIPAVAKLFVTGNFFITRRRMHGILGERERPNVAETRLASSLRG